MAFQFMTYMGFSSSIIGLDRDSKDPPFYLSTVPLLDKIVFLDYQATAIHLTKDIDEVPMAVFLFDYLLDKEYPMFSEKEYEKNKRDGIQMTYENSTLRKTLQNLSKKIPEDLKKFMVPFNNGDLLSIPSVTNVFGKNQYGFEHENDSEEYFSALSDPREMIGVTKKNITSPWWTRSQKWMNHMTGVSVPPWCRNETNTYTLSTNLGVRPMFMIKVGVK